MSTSPEDFINEPSGNLFHMSPEERDRAILEGTGLVMYSSLLKFARPEDFEGSSINFAGLGKEVIKAYVGNDVKRFSEREIPSTEFDSSPQVVEFSHRLALEMKEEYVRDTWLIDTRRASRSDRLTDKAIRVLRKANRADQVGAVVIAQGYDDIRPEPSSPGIQELERMRAEKIKNVVKKLKIPALILNVVEAKAPIEVASIGYEDDTPTAFQISQAIRQEYSLLLSEEPDVNTVEEYLLDEDLDFNDILDAPEDEELRLLQENGIAEPGSPIVREDKMPDPDLEIYDEDELELMLLEEENGDELPSGRTINKN